MKKGFFSRFFGSDRGPLSEADKMPFRLKIQSVFTIPKYGTVAAGVVESGRLQVGDDVATLDRSGITLKLRVIGIEKLRDLVDEARTGDSIGVLLRDAKESDLVVGNALTEPLA